MGRVTRFVIAIKLISSTSTRDMSSVQISTLRNRHTGESFGPHTAAAHSGVAVGHLLDLPVWAPVPSAASHASVQPPALPVANQAPHALPVADQAPLALPVPNQAAQPPRWGAVGHVPPPLRVELEYYSVNAGLDQKFSSELPGELRGLVSQSEFETFVDDLNLRLRRYRHKHGDIVLLLSGPTLLPLIPFIFRHQKKARKSKEVQLDMCKDFDERFGARGIQLRLDRNQGSLYICQKLE